MITDGGGIRPIGEGNGGGVPPSVIIAFDLRKNSHADGGFSRQSRDREAESIVNKVACWSVGCIASHQGSATDQASWRIRAFNEAVTIKV